MYIYIYTHCIYTYIFAATCNMGTVLGSKTCKRTALFRTASQAARVAEANSSAACPRDMLHTLTNGFGLTLATLKSQLAGTPSSLAPLGCFWYEALAKDLLFHLLHSSSDSCPCLLHRSRGRKILLCRGTLGRWIWIKSIRRELWKTNRVRVHSMKGYNLIIKRYIRYIYMYNIYIYNYIYISAYIYISERIKKDVHHPFFVMLFSLPCLVPQWKVLMGPSARAATRCWHASGSGAWREWQLVASWVNLLSKT